MTKYEAVRKMVAIDFAAIPLEWAQIVAEAKNEEIFSWPMWGTVFLVDDWYVKKLKTRYMVADKEAIDFSYMSTDEAKRVKKAVKDEDDSILEDYVDEEMDGTLNILDKDGDPTAAYLYEIDGQFLIGVNGAGFSFYDGVWDKIYDAMELQWHDTDEKKQEIKITISGGVLQDVEGLPKGWGYELVDLDDEAEKETNPKS